MSLVYANVRSAYCNLNPLYASLNNLNLEPEIYALTETWYRDNFPVYLHNYSCCGTGNRKGGGVGFYYKNNLSITQFPEFALFNPDIESYVIKNSRTDMFYIIVYRPHSATLKNFFDSLKNIILKTLMKSRRKKITIAGDFNIDLAKSTPCSNELLNTLISLNFHQNYFDQTRSSGKCIDNIFTNFNAKVKSLDLDISDHAVLFFEETNITDTKTNTQIRNYNIINLNKYANKIADVNWLNLYKLDNINDAYEYFEAEIKKPYNACFNLINISNRQESWVNGDIKNLLKVKHKAQKLASYTFE